MAYLMISDAWRIVHRMPSITMILAHDNFYFTTKNSDFFSSYKIVLKFQFLLI